MFSGERVDKRVVGLRFLLMTHLPAEKAARRVEAFVASFRVRAYGCLLMRAVLCCVHVL